MTDLQKKYGSYPGAVNVAAIDAAPGVIQSAFVRCDAARKRARVELGYYPSTDREARREAAQAAVGRVGAYLGDGWVVR